MVGGGCNRLRAVLVPPLIVVIVASDACSLICLAAVVAMVLGVCGSGALVVGVTLADVATFISCSKLLIVMSVSAWPVDEPNPSGSVIIDGPIVTGAVMSCCCCCCCCWFIIIILTSASIGTVMEVSPSIVAVPALGSKVTMMRLARESCCGACICICICCICCICCASIGLIFDTSDSCGCVFCISILIAFIIGCFGKRSISIVVMGGGVVLVLVACCCCCCCRPTLAGLIVVVVVTSIRGRAVVDVDVLDVVVVESWLKFDEVLIVIFIALIALAGVRIVVTATSSSSSESSPSEPFAESSDDDPSPALFSEGPPSDSRSSPSSESSSLSSAASASVAFDAVVVVVVGIGAADVDVLDVDDAGLCVDGSCLSARIITALNGCWGAKVVDGALARGFVVVVTLTCS